MKTKPIFPILCSLQSLCKCFSALLFCLLLSAGEIFAQPVAIDPTFGENGMTVIPNIREIKKIDFDKSGNIVVMGVKKIDGTNYLTIVKTNADGILDQNFGNNGVVTLFDFNLVNEPGLKIKDDNKIFITGDFYIPQLDSYRRIFMQFNEDGSFDDTFGVNGKVFTSYGNVWSNLANLENNNFIVIGGWQWNGVEEPVIPFITKYNYDGEMDETFGNNGIVYLTDNEAYNIQPRCIKILSDQSVFIAGFDCLNSLDSEVAFCKLNQSGNFVADFANNGIWKMNIYYEAIVVGFSKTELFDNAIEDNYGNIILVGHITMDTTTFVCSFNHEGTMNSDFGSNGFFYHNNLRYYSNYDLDYGPKILLQERKYIIGASRNIIRVNSNGTLDVSFNDNGMFTFENFTLQDMKLQRADKLILSGYSFGNSAITRLNIPSKVSQIENNNLFYTQAIFPNPVKDYLYFKEVSKFEIMDIRGKVLLKSEIPMQTVNVSRLKSGVYFIKLEENQVEKFVKE